VSFPSYRAGKVIVFFYSSKDSCCVENVVKDEIDDGDVDDEYNDLDVVSS
jgi:hypothetical protein